MRNPLSQDRNVMQCESKVLLIGGSPCFALSVNAATLSNSEDVCRVGCAARCLTFLGNASLIFCHLQSSKTSNPMCQGTNLMAPSVSCLSFFAVAPHFSMHFEVSKMCYSDSSPTEAMSTLRGTHSASGQNVGMDSQNMC